MHARILSRQKNVMLTVLRFHHHYPSIDDDFRATVLFSAKCDDLQHLAFLTANVVSFTPINTPKTRSLADNRLTAVPPGMSNSLHPHLLKL